MPQTTVEIKTFKGLYLQRNSFTVPEGALEVASNVVIPSEDVITRARGFYDYFTVSSGTLNNLHTYQDKLLAFYQDKVRYYTDTGVSPNETGSEGTISPDTGVTVSIADSNRVARSVESNGNFYFTTDNGVLKLQSYNGTIYKAGAPQGLDLSSRYINGSNSTWLTAGNMVGHRVVFGYQDSNDNLILGAPSEIVTINNPLVAATTTVVGSVVTVTSVGHGLVTGQYLVFSAAAGGAGTPGNADGNYQITVSSVDVFTYTAGSAPGAITTISYGYAMPVRLEFSVPSELTTSLTWFYQVYRSSQQLISVGIFSDFKLIEQKNLTSAEISAEVVFYTDDWDDILLGAELYTNENSREGELQSNFRPPLCNDVTLYKGYTLYASCTTRMLKEWAVVDPTALVTSDFIEVAVSSLVRRYVARTGIGNKTVRATCSSSTGLLFTSVAHGFTATGLWTVYVANQTGGSIATGFYYVLYVDADTFRVADTIANWITATPIAYDSETSAEVQGDYTSEATVVGSSWARASNVVTITSTAHGLSVGMEVYASNAATGTLATNIYTITVAATNTFSFASTGSDETGTIDYNSFQPTFYLSASSSASVRLRDTAQGLIKAVNRDTDSIIYAQYISGINSVPGKMRFQAKGFGAAMYFRANTTAAGTAFSPILPASFSSGTQVYSRNDSQPHGFYSSKSNEPEAVPLVNFFPAGAKNAMLLRSRALRDSVILIKDDGVWRVTGDNPSNFSVTLLDGTVRCVSASSIDVLNNQVIFLSNQGVCLVTENSVQIVSRKVEEVIQPILGQSNLANVTAGLAYETERLYLITTSEPNGTAATQTYCYNILTDAWTTWDDWLFAEGVIGPNDVMYYFNTTDNNIMRERKKQTKIDYCGQNHNGTVASVAAGQLSATITFTTVSPVAGDIIVISDVVNVITEVLTLSATSYTCTFQRQSNLVAADSIILYKGYTSTIKLAPFHAGMVGRTKQFSQLQVHFRDESCTRMNITFTGQTFGGSEATDWNANIVRAGWGSFPWGFEPWGQQTSTVLLQGSQSAPVCRILVPRFQQRGTYIQPILENTIAGEPLNIQAMVFTVRAYNERVTR